MGHKENKIMASKGIKIELLPENNMVKKVFLLKMAFTLFGLIPFIFFPKSLIVFIGIPCNDTTMFVRSLGFLYIALFFVYSSGYIQAKKNSYPINVVLFGTYTNGFSFILFLTYLLIGEFNNWGYMGKMMIYSSGFLFFFITLMLIISLVMNFKKYKNDIIWNR
jgi:hypothetical protein